MGLRARLDRAHELEPVELRHVDVANDAVGPRALDVHQPFEPVARHLHHEPLRRQQLPQKSLRSVVVLHHEHPVRRHCVPPETRHDLRMRSSRPRVKMGVEAPMYRDDRPRSRRRTRL